MANLKAGTLLAGNLIWHTGNMPLRATDDKLYFKDREIYTEFNKPTLDSIGAVAKIGDTMTGNLTIATVDDNTFSLQAGTNKNATFIMGEDSLKHGFYIKYGGASNNRTRIGMISNNVELDSIRLTRGTTSVEFESSPIVVGPQGAAGGALTRKDYVDTKVSKSGDTMTGRLIINNSNDGDVMTIKTGVRDGVGAAISFSDNPSAAYTGSLSYHYLPSPSYGGTDSFRFSSNKTSLNVVLEGAGNFKVGNNSVYHEGHKPTPEEVGALPVNGKAADSDRLGGMTIARFIRTDISGTINGGLTALGVSATLNHTNGYFTLHTYDTGPTHNKIPDSYVSSYMTTRNNIAEWTLTGNNSDGAGTPMRLSVNGHFYSTSAPSDGYHMTNKSYVDGRDNLKVNKAGDTMSGSLTFADQSDGISFTYDEGAVSPTSKSSGSWITGGHDSAVMDTLSNVAVQTSFGFSVSPIIDSTVKRGENAFLVEARTGVGRFAGTIYANKNQQVYHEGHKPTAGDINAYTKAESDSRFVNATGDTMSGHLTLTGSDAKLRVAANGAGDPAIELAIIDTNTGFKVRSNDSLDVMINNNSIASFNNYNTTFNKDILVQNKMIQVKAETPRVWLNTTEQGTYGASWSTYNGSVYLKRHNNDDPIPVSGPSSIDPMSVSMTSGDVQISGGMTAYYRGSTAFAEQYRTKAPLFTTVSTGGSSEYRPIIKQRISKIGINAGDMVYSVGQLLMDNDFAGLYVHGIKAGASDHKTWSFKPSGDFVVNHGGVQLFGASSTTGTVSIEMDGNSNSKWTEDNLVIESHTPMIRLHDKTSNVDQVILSNKEGGFCVSNVGQSAVPTGADLTYYQVYHEGHKPTGAELGGTSAPTANTLVMRDASSDIHARLFRSNYADSETMSGAIAFRVNSSSDNYNRYCSNNAAVRTWLDVPSESELDGRYVNIAGDTMTGVLSLTDTSNYPLRFDQSSINANYIGWFQDKDFKGSIGVGVTNTLYLTSKQPGSGSLSGEMRVQYDKVSSNVGIHAPTFDLPAGRDTQYVRTRSFVGGNGVTLVQMNDIKAHPTSSWLWRNVDEHDIADTKMALSTENGRGVLELSGMKVLHAGEVGTELVQIHGGVVGSGVIDLSKSLEYFKYIIFVTRHHTAGGHRQTSTMIPTKLFRYMEQVMIPLGYGANSYRCEYNWRDNRAITFWTQDPNYLASHTIYGCN